MPSCHKKRNDSETHTQHHCPSGQGLKLPQQRLKHKWLVWTLPITGLLALIWFLVRVIPKPSRALYPCQRVAMPLASGFVAWLIGLVGAFAAFRRARLLFRHSYVKLALLCLTLALVFGTVAVVNMPQTALSAAEVGEFPASLFEINFPGAILYVVNNNFVK